LLGEIAHTAKITVSLVEQPRGISAGAPLPTSLKKRD